MRALTTRVEWLNAKAGASQAEVTDRSVWDWFAGSCSCRLPPGECRRIFETPHRMAQRRPRGLLERRGARACALAQRGNRRLPFAPVADGDSDLEPISNDLRLLALHQFPWRCNLRPTSDNPAAGRSRREFARSLAAIERSDEQNQLVYDADGQNFKGTTAADSPSRACHKKRIHGLGIGRARDA
jgi:hypothetical protein